MRRGSKTGIPAPMATITPQQNAMNRGVSQQHRADYAARHPIHAGVPTANIKRPSEVINPVDPGGIQPPNQTINPVDPGGIDPNTGRPVGGGEVINPIDPGGVRPTWAARHPQHYIAGMAQRMRQGFGQLQPQAPSQGQGYGSSGQSQGFDPRQGGGFNQGFGQQFIQNQWQNPKFAGSGSNAYQQFPGMGQILGTGKGLLSAPPGAGQRVSPGVYRGPNGQLVRR